MYSVNCHRNCKGRKTISVSTAFDGTQVYNEVAYDALGRKWREYLPYTGTRGLYTEYAYDVLNRLRKTINPHGDVLKGSGMSY